MPALGLKALARDAIIGLGSRLPLEALTYSIRRDVIVLMYHAVGEVPVPHLRNLYPYKTPAQFEADLVFLKREFDLPTYAEFAARAHKSRQAKRPSLLITFDDGLSECYHYVRPLLLKYQVPCVFFVTKSFVDNRALFFRHKVSLCIERFRDLSSSAQDGVWAALISEIAGSNFAKSNFLSWIMQLGHADQPAIDRTCALLEIDIAEFLSSQRPYMTSDEIRELHSDGFTIGGHSVTHPALWRTSKETTEFEILESCRFVRDLVGTNNVPFAFPFSADGVNRDLLRSIADRNPWISAMFGSNGIELEEPLLLNRINVDQPPGGSLPSNALPLIKDSYAVALYRSLRSN